MSTEALVLMLGSWAVIAYFTVRFFLKVLRTPPREDGD